MDEELLADFDSFTAPQEEVPTETPIAETQPIETVGKPSLTEPAIVPEENQMLSDFDTFTQPQIDPVEQHRPPEVDDSVWEDIKGRVGKYLGKAGETALKYGTALAATATALPRASFSDIQEQTTEASQITAKARTYKALEENYQFSYSQLKDTFNAAVHGDKEAALRLSEQKDLVNNNAVKAMELEGITAFYDNGELLVRVIGEDGEPTLKNLDEDTFANIASGFSAQSGEIAGGIGGAIKGAYEGAKLGKSPKMKALGAVVGGATGGYIGTLGGSLMDLTRSAITLNKEIDASEIFNIATGRAAAGTLATAGIALAGKTVSKAVAPISKVIKKATDRVLTLYKTGDIQGAKQIVKDDYNLSDKDIDDLFESVAKDVKGLDKLQGDDLLRQKLLAAEQQQAQGETKIIGALKQNLKGSVETSKEIDLRAKEVLKFVKTKAKKPSAIQKGIKGKEKSVKDNYGEVKGMIDEAVPNYKPDLDIVSFKKTILDVNKRVIDPTVKEKVENLAEVLASQPNKNVGDLIETRKLYNNFYGKNSHHFNNKNDMDALRGIQDTIDSKIDEAIDSIGNKDIAKQLKDAFTDAKQKYVKMFEVQDTASYSKIFKKGIREPQLGKALINYSQSIDGDLEKILNKLSPVQRVKSEFSIINEILKRSMGKTKAKSIDFGKLLEGIGASKNSLKSKEAKQFIKNIEDYDKKFGKDVGLQKATETSIPKEINSIATSVAGKAKMMISGIQFKAIQRLAWSDEGRRLSLQKSLELALQQSRTPREFFFKASKAKGMPNTTREALKKAIKEIGEQEQLIKKNAQEAMDKALKEEATKKQKKILSEKKLQERKWEKAKAERMKEVEAQKKGPSIEESKEQARQAKKPLSPQAQKVKDASVPEIGAEIDAEKKAVKNIFAKNKSDEAKYKGMSPEDIAEMDRLDAIEAQEMFGDVQEAEVKSAIDKTTRDANFKKWFKDSKVVDDNGKPLVVYHGSSSKFEVFKTDAPLFTQQADGVYFSSKKGAAKKYGENLYEVNLSIKNPLEIDGEGKSFNELQEKLDYEIRWAEKDGYDGVIIKNIKDSPTGKGGSIQDTYVVFEPNQIKSVNNSGAYSKDGNILKGALTVGAVGGTNALSQKESN